MTFPIPYGSGHMELHIGDGFDVELLVPRGPGGEANEAALVRAALDNPIGSRMLVQLAEGKRRAVLLCSDHTRPVPSKILLPPMLKDLRQGNPAIDVTLLVATGAHRGITPDELLQKFGEDIVRSERIVVHDCDDKTNLVPLGTLPSGAPLVVNRLAAEADLLLAEGFIEPHFFAGFSGGRKSVLPGVCARETVLGNHCAAFIEDPRARTGVLEGNPIHRDMLAAARMAGLAFIANVTLDADKHITAAFAGEPEQAHAAGCEYLRSLCTVRPRRPADIVVTSNGGAPLDQNIYQAVKGMTAAEAAAAPGAVIIMAAACADGAGGESFEHMLAACESPLALAARIRRVPMDRTEPDQWQAQILARILKKHRVILVCEPDAAARARQMKLETAASLNEAFQTALADKGRQARVIVIPDGVSVIVDSYTNGTMQKSTDCQGADERLSAF